MGKKALKPFKIKSYPKNLKPGNIFGANDRSKDEKSCAKLLRQFGFDIYFQKESKISGVHTPDIVWKKDNKKWEIKTLYGNSYDNTAHAIASALEQSSFVIINASKTRRDIRRIAMDAIKYNDKPKTKKIKEMIIMSKTKYCYIEQAML